MSEKFPDKYRGSYNSDKYKIEANGGYFIQLLASFGKI